MSRKKAKPFTNSELDRIVKLKEIHGMSFRSIGRELDRNNATVCKAYHKHKDIIHARRMLLEPELEDGMMTRFFKWLFG